jgi:2',3'-cyclic-nucleotide 2'-phosphodiesterase (5'-nucleotidase family)
LLLDAGDALIGGGVLGDMTQGEVIVAGMNMMGYDAMVLGPRELSLGVDLLQQRMEEAEFPVLSANVVLSGSQELFAEPYRIVEIEGRKIGVIGLTRVPAKAQDGFAVLDPEEAAVRYVPEVSEQAEVVVVLTNMAYPTGLALAAAVPEIDLLIAGRAERIPGKPAQVPSTGTLAVTTEPPAKRHTGRQVGTLIANVESDGTLSLQSWQATPLGPKIPDDTQMKALLDSYR